MIAGLIRHSNDCFVNSPSLVSLFKKFKKDIAAYGPMDDIGSVIVIIYIGQNVVATIIKEITGEMQLIDV